MVKIWFGFMAFVSIGGYLFFSGLVNPNNMNGLDTAMKTILSGGI